MVNNILEIRNLWVEYHSDTSVIKALNGIDLVLEEGRTLGLVGETGAGKTTTALSIMHLLPEEQTKVKADGIFFKGENLLDRSADSYRKIRGKSISMIFQDPMVALNPVLTVGEQIAEVIRLHEKTSRVDATLKAREMLEIVGISGERYAEYPHQFSGGMRQRVVIAISLACNPALLIADEPTTALDVTIQAQVLELMNNLRRDFNTSMLFITHDLGVVSEMCDNVAIMYCGEIVEYGTLEDIFLHPGHPYTKGLFNSIPDLNVATRRLKPIPGMIPDPADLPEGCKFAERCDEKIARCEKELPPVKQIGDSHQVKCWLPERGDGAVE